MRYIIYTFIIFILAHSHSFSQNIPILKISQNHRFIQTSEGKPFFWLGDTGWLLFSKLNREEALLYLDDRKEKGFNIVQVMGLHKLKLKNTYGDSALIEADITRPNITEGNAPNDANAYDYWDHIDFIIDQAAIRGIFIGFVPIWGNNIKEGKISIAQITQYATFLAKRYASKPNIIWLNGGDIRGGEALEVWNALGETLRLYDKTHLITFHPRGRTLSSDWFHNQHWLDFNMAQSGHKSYKQDTLKTENRHFGEDNWRYIHEAYTLKPAKPILDGEPSYENIPQGLHDTTQARWTDADVRRYAYWSVFAGACGFTYGHNSVMQMFKNEENEEASYNPLMGWKESLNATGASQMQFLKKLMENDPTYFDRKPAQDLVLNQSEKYDYIAVCQSSKAIYAYVYTGRAITLRLGSLKTKILRGYWYNPRTGEMAFFKDTPNKGRRTFHPKNGKDWVLVLETSIYAG
jgi:Protein of unknown function (DUF4038)/Putative collagen-binding domain of a collagenase